MTGERVVLDASALVDLLIAGPTADWVTEQVSGCEVVAPAHIKSEVLSALGRRARAGSSMTADVDAAIEEVARTRVGAHSLDGLISGAWKRRNQVSLADALYVELAAQLDTVVVTTDRRLARATPLAVAPPEE